MPFPMPLAASRPRRAQLLLAMALTMVMAGCVTPLPPPESGADITLPDDWAAARHGSTPTALTDWWRRFDDPVLTSLVTQALQANTDVRSARAALLQARALRDVAAAALAPTLGSSANIQRSRNGGHAGNSFQVGLDAGWELDLFGARQRGLDASAASTLASAATLGHVQVSMTAELALAYITLRGSQQRLAIANANLDSQRASLQITQWRLQAGLASGLDSEQASAAAAQTAAQLPALQTAIEQTRHALAVLTGQPPAALATVLATAGSLPRAPDDIALDFPAETLRQRADVRAAELQLHAAAARVSQAEAQRLPSLRLGGSLGLNALTLGALTNGASVAASLLAGVSLPLFDGGAAVAQVRTQQAAQTQAQVAYQATVLSALREVEDALVALRGDRARLQNLQQAAEAAGNAARLASLRYRTGLIDFQVVLETQRTQFSTQDGVVSASADVVADHARLYKALGGGWSPASLPTDLPLAGVAQDAARKAHP
jgi:outer membrane protein, multidrug efflux system